MKLIALQPLANHIQPGEEFDATESEARTHLLIGSAKLAEPAPPEPPPEPQLSGRSPATRRPTYRRRDLTAED